MTRAGATALCVLVASCVIPISPAGTVPPADAMASAQPDGTVGGEGSTSPDGAGGREASSIPPGDWTNATGNLAGMASECGNLMAVAAKPDEDLLVTGVSLHGLWASSNGGAAWKALGTGQGSATIINRMTSAAFDPTAPMRYWESGIYNGAGVYVTNDDGLTFTQLGNITHCDYVSVDFSDPNRQTILAGGHEQAQTVHKSSDGGMTWTMIGAGLPAMTNCTFPFVLDSQTYLVGCGGYGGGPTGVYRTSDGGSTWNVATKSGGGGAALYTHDKSTIYWSTANGQGMTRSADMGVTWTDTVGPGIVRPTTPIELPDGRIATLGQDYILLSSDKGVSWSPATPKFPYNDVVGLTYSVQEKAFYIWHFSCGQGNVPVPSDGIMRFAFDYQHY